VIDFLSDFDHMRHGQITENEFRRGVKIVFAKLNEPELSALARTYQSKKDPRMVDYVAFSDEIESVFTVKGLQTNPTYEMTEYIPDDMDPTLNILSAKDQAAYQQIIDGMVEKVRQRRIDPLTYLEDFDFIKEGGGFYELINSSGRNHSHSTKTGTITTNQFRSVLNEVGLAVNDEEIKVLAHRFATTKALDRVNYRSFAAALSQSAGDDSEDFVF
jgi:Ca2+-binding EF-hand superfamily protein